MTQSLYLKLLKVGRLHEILPSNYAVDMKKRAIGTLLDGFDPKTTPHGVSLDPQVFVESRIRLQGLENEEELTSIWSADAAVVYLGGLRNVQTKAGMKDLVITPKKIPPEPEKVERGYPKLKCCSNLQRSEHLLK